MDRFAICQAYAQLEADYNLNGWLHERPSNQRRRESIGCQLQRMGYRSPFDYVDIAAEPDIESDDCEAEDIRQIYMAAVLRLNLPIDADLMAAMHRVFTPDFLARYPQTAGADYRQGRPSTAWLAHVTRGQLRDM